MHARVVVTLAALLISAPALAGSTAPSLSQTFKRVGGAVVVVGGDIVLAVEGIALGAQDAYEEIRKRMIEVRDRNGSLRVTVLRAGAIVELTGTVEL
jgi:hypothetical protein